MPPGFLEGPRLQPGATPAIVVLATGAAFGTASILLDWPIAARVGVVATACLVLWLVQLVPVWLPTLLLWGGAAALLAGQGASFTPLKVLGWFGDPVLLLFLGGFALAAAAQRQEADRAL